jgi:hypothetical protein
VRRAFKAFLDDVGAHNDFVDIQSVSNCYGEKLTGETELVTQWQRLQICGLGHERLIRRGDGCGFGTPINVISCG